MNRVDLAKINPRVPIDGKRLRDARQRAGFTLKELDRRSGKNYVDLFRLETGKQRRVTFQILGKVAQALGVEVDYLSGSADSYTERVKTPGMPEGFPVTVTKRRNNSLSIKAGPTAPGESVPSDEYLLVERWIDPYVWRSLFLGAGNRPLTPSAREEFLKHMIASLEIILESGTRVNLDGLKRFVRMFWPPKPRRSKKDTRPARPL